jgi:catechol 2,3-dioxygenase-like lactoylglutathione lyase family enzyme
MTATGSTTLLSADHHTMGNFKDAKIETKLEAIALPVSDLDRAKEFYTRLGWRLDADFRQGDDRVIQLTPPGSACSIHLGTGVTTAAPGSAQGLLLVVSDIQAAREELMAHGAEVSEIFHFAAGPGPFGGIVGGLAPNHASYGSYATFADPDGNGWLLQEVTTRFPGRIDSGVTSFGSADGLVRALRRAAEAHGEHEKRVPGPHDDWPEWYAAYMVAEQSGAELPT